MNSTLKNILVAIGVIALIYFIYRIFFPKKYTLADGVVVDERTAYYLSGVNDSTSGGIAQRTKQTTDCSELYGKCYINKGNGCALNCNDASCKSLCNGKTGAFIIPKFTSTKLNFTSSIIG